VKKTALVAASLMMVGPALTVANAAQGGRPNARKAEVKYLTESPELVVGTVQYDTGTNAGFHPDGANGTNLNRVVGNRFNSALGGPLLAAGTVTMLTVFPANNGTQSVSIGSAPSTMNTVMVFDYITANMMAAQFNVVTVAPAVSVTADFVGLFLGTFGSTQAAGLLGMSDMATMGQGYHALEGFYLSGMVGTMFQTVPNRNAMLRASGNILTPVELMDFKIQ
jgi:hypothetical protein